MHKILLLPFLALMLALPMAGKGQILVDTTYSSKEIVNDILLGNRVKVSNVRYVGSRLSLAVFKDTSATPLMAQGIMLSTGRVMDAKGPNRHANATYGLGTRGDRMLEPIARGQTFDAAYLEFDFIPEMESVVFNFVFGSEEYTEYVNTQFNDVFAFFISGPGYKGMKNLAIVPSNNAPITVNTVNHIFNTTNYIDNNPFDRLGTLQKAKIPLLYPDLLRNYEFDGFTTLLSADARVKPGQVYHLKIVIADVSDGRYDSAVFLEANSFTSVPQDPEKRAEILAEEYGTVKRKFRPVKVGEDPKQEAVTVKKHEVDDGDALGTEDATSGEKRYMIHFAFDAASLSASEKSRLDSIWTHVLSKTTRKVIVRGHTDNVGGEGYNVRLSEERAAAVLAYLQQKGLPKNRISTAAYGFHKPATTNNSESGRAINRRVEISLE